MEKVITKREKFKKILVEDVDTVLNDSLNNKELNKLIDILYYHGYIDLLPDDKVDIRQKYRNMWKNELRNLAERAKRTS